MAWVVGTGAFLGVLAIALGILALRTGWVAPTVRRQVTRPKLHGLGALLAGTSVLLQSLFYFRILPSASWEVRFFGGNAFLFAGLLLIVLSQLLRPRQSPDHADPSSV
jgi:phosphoglycerol transferase MdoB-like AlkP superfamily enzyme